MSCHVIAERVPGVSAFVISLASQLRALWRRFKDAIFATSHAAAQQDGEKDRVLAFTFGWDETRQPHTVATAASSKTQPVGPAAADDDIAIMDVQQLGS